MFGLDLLTSIVISAFITIIPVSHPSSKSLHDANINENTAEPQEFVPRESPAYVAAAEKFLALWFSNGRLKPPPLEIRNTIGGDKRLVEFSMSTYTRNLPQEECFTSWSATTFCKDMKYIWVSQAVVWDCSDGIPCRVYSRTSSAIRLTLFQGTSGWEVVDVWVNPQ